MSNHAVDHWINVATQDAITPGKRQVIYLGNLSILIINQAGLLYAIENRCSHDDSPLVDGEIDGTTIVCPYHGACFSLKDGTVLSPPAYEDIAVFPLRIHHGMIQLHDDSAL